MSKTLPYQIENLELSLSDIAFDIDELTSAVETLSEGVKLATYNGRVVLTQSSTVVDIPILEYNPETDLLNLYIGGIYQKPNEEYVIDGPNRQVNTTSVVWDVDDVLDFLVFKNVMTAPMEHFDGALIDDGTVAREKLHVAVTNELDALQSKAEFTSGIDTFLTGLTHTVTDAFITSNTFVNVIPTMEKAGEWSVESANGSFTITSDTAETSITFEWNAIKAGA